MLSLRRMLAASAFMTVPGLFSQLYARPVSACAAWSGGDADEAAIVEVFGKDNVNAPAPVLGENPLEPGAVVVALNPV